MSRMADIASTGLPLQDPKPPVAADRRSEPQKPEAGPTAQPADPARPETGAEKPPGSPGRKLLGLGTLSVVLATIAEIVGSIQKIEHFVVDLIGLRASKDLHLILVVLFGAIMVAGYCAAAYWIYLRLRSRPPRARVVFTAVAALVLFGLAAASFALMPRSPQAKDYVAEETSEWAGRLASEEDPSGGAPISVMDAEAPTQVWATAQAIKAILASNLDPKQAQGRVWRGLEYIERARLKGSPGGWGYFEDWQTSVTEIAGWVGVAEAAALSPPWRDAWSAEQRRQIVDRSNQVSSMLVSTQQADGGWGPTAQKGPGLSRTYSTVMAVWSLIEADRAADVTSAPGSPSDHAINNGLKWLIANHDPGLGWVPNPARQGQNERFLGLHAQVLYVLSRVEATRHARALDMPAYTAAKVDFLASTDFEQRRIDDNNRIHDGDRYLRPQKAMAGGAPGSQVGPCTCPFTVEGSTFLWYPWSLAAAKALAVDSSMAPEQQAKALAIANTLEARLTDSRGLVGTGFTYVMAEFVIGATPGSAQTVKSRLAVMRVPSRPKASR